MKNLSALLLALLVCLNVADNINSQNEFKVLSKIEATTCMSKCLECQNGPNSCTKCTEGQDCCNWACQQCQNHITCKTCQQGFELDQKLNICVSKYSCSDLQCKDCDYDNLICTKCYDGFYLNSQMLTCQKCVSKCISCESEDNCTECIAKTYLQNGSCLNCQQNCQVCRSIATCDFCTESYYIDKKGNCTKCMDSCVKCTTGKDCQQCKPRFYFDTDSSKCLACPITCTQCKSYNECLKCEPDYYFNKTLKSCQTCQQFYPHCLTCHNTTEVALQTTICMKCEFKYYVLKNACSPCSQNCFQCDSKSSCKTCAQKYFINSSRQCELCQIIYCIQCETKDLCNICQQSYYWNGNVSKLQCIRCPYGCRSCDRFQCMQCAYGFYLKNGHCHRCDTSCYQCSQGPNHCNICMPGYFKIEIDWGECTKCAQPCYQCNNITSCTRCMHGFYLDGDVCRKCQIQDCDQCQLVQMEVIVNKQYDDYLNRNKNGSALQQRRISTDGNRICLRCSQGHFFGNSSICQKCLPGCKKCQDITYCNSCYRGYSINPNSTKCTKCPQHSISCQIDPFNQTNFIISQCQNGYTRNMTLMTCILCVDHCKLCVQNSPSHCLDCVQGYYQFDLNQTNRQCRICLPPCKECESATQCLSCIIGYYLDQSDNCIKCGQGCEECSQQGCFVCSQGYRINIIDRKCQQCKIRNCQYCRHNIQQCDTCQSGYTLYKVDNTSLSLLLQQQSTNQLCYRCDQSINGCKQCSSPYTCTQCFNGLTLSQLVNSPTTNDSNSKATNSCIVQDKQSNNNNQVLYFIIIGVLGIVCLLLIGNKFIYYIISFHIQNQKKHAQDTQQQDSQTKLNINAYSDQLTDYQSD